MESPMSTGDWLSIEKRRSTRRHPNSGEALARFRMRLGPELDVLNVCDTGALVEATVRLAPGARLDVHVTTHAGRVLVRCRVVRSFACFVAADAIRYRGGLAFDQPVDTSGGYPVPATLQGTLQPSGNRYPGERPFEALEREK
jgi:hypothetical protein